MVYPNRQAELPGLRGPTRSQLQRKLEETKAVSAKQSEELEEVVSMHLKVSARYDELRSSNTIKEANFQTTIVSLSSRVEELCENNIELLDTIINLRKESETMDWEKATEMPEFEPIRDVLFSRAVKSTNEVTLTKYSDLNVDLLVIGESAKLVPERKRAIRDDVEPSKVNEKGAAPECESEKEMEKKRRPRRRQRRTMS